LGLRNLWQSYGRSQGFFRVPGKRRGGRVASELTTGALGWKGWGVAREIRSSQDGSRWDWTEKNLRKMNDARSLQKNSDNLT